MFLGIEIGGTKLQLGVGVGDGQIVDLVRCDVDAAKGAAGILEQINSAAAELGKKHRIERIGIGFGGPIDAANGFTTKSHQIAGWERFPLARWCQEHMGRPATLANDCDAAAVGEARFGAGVGTGSVFYATVGTGIGGGLVIGGRLHGVGRPAAAEIGHLRPGLNANRPEITVESLAAGPAIAAAARSRLADAQNGKSDCRADLLRRCGNNLDELTAKTVAAAAAEGNEIARQVLAHACQALGWAIAQVITLVAPEIVVVGGGVSLIGEPFFFVPLRAEVARYVFPPLADSYKIVPAALGELAVVHGAIALAADQTTGGAGPTAATRPGIQ
ncbi:MAG TPA: ROK family protein [Pirellulaceae bacterium]|jgi:glucokinase